MSFRLINASVRKNALAMVNSLPLDGTLELVIRPYKRPQSHEQRKLMWGIRLAEISQQAWIGGRQWPVKVWHEVFKERYLPDAPVEGETLDGYVKWLDMPDGSRKMVGSTTKLTTKGQVNYMTQIEVYAAQELGVQFSADILS